MKKTILFASILAVFVMLMIPNISAVEYQTVNGIYKQKSDTVQSIIGFLSKKTEFSAGISNFIVILSEFFQGFFMIGMFLFSIFILDSADNWIIGIIVYYALAVLTGFISSSWDSYLINNYDLTKIQEIIISYLGLIMIFSFILIFHTSKTNGNFVEKNL